MQELPELTPHVAIKLEKALKCQIQSEFFQVFLISVLMDSCPRHPECSFYGAKDLHVVSVGVSRRTVSSGKGKTILYF